MAGVVGIGEAAGRGVRPRLVAAALGCLVLAGCAAQSATPPPAAPATAAPAPTTPAAFSPDLCSAAADFQTAANAIVALNASAVGTGGVKKVLQDLEAAANALVAAAREQFGPQVTELEKAIDSLQGTIAGLSSTDSPSTNLGKIAASVAVVEEAAKPIVDSVRAGCPAVPTVEAPPTG